MPAIAEPSDRIEAVSAAQFYVSPDEAFELSWRGAGMEEQAYEVMDYWGRPITSGQTQPSGPGIVKVTLTLPRGYYEVRLAETHQVFGVAVMEPGPTEADAFFAIDSALSWLEPRADARRELIDVMVRSGMSMSRERISLGGIAKSPGVMDFESDRQYESLRQDYREAGIPVLEMFYGRVPQLGSREGFQYYTSLSDGAQVWQDVIERFGSAWGSVEVWNEPDLITLPADQYVPMAKMISYAQSQSGSTVPLGGGVFGGNLPGLYQATCSANGLLNVVDYISFHTYEDASTLIRLVKAYREWLAENGKTGMPLWLTEFGKPWTIGPSRAPMDEDARVAMSMAAMSSEARALGVERVFAFVLPFYEEGGVKSFSMLGRGLSPMRSMSAYCNAIRVLSHHQYVGDVPGVTGTSSVRVFERDGSPVVVIYADQFARDTVVDLGIPLERVEGVDGRVLAQELPDGVVAVPDGVAYAWPDPQVLAKVIDRESEAMTINRLAQIPVDSRQSPCPIVLSHRLEPNGAKLSPRLYLLPQESAQQFELTVRVHNLSGQAHSVTLHPQLPGGSSDVNITKRQFVLAPNSFADLNWTLDVSAALDISEPRMVRVVGQTSNGQAIEPLAIPYLMSGDLESHLARHTYQVPLDIQNLDAWQTNITHHGRMSMETTPRGWKAELSFEKPGDCWAYPRLRLTQPIDTDRARGILVRAKLSAPGKNVALMLMQSGKIAFWKNEIMPADNQWHVAYIPFSELEPQPGNEDMLNAVFDLARLSDLQFGMQSWEPTNTFEISHLIVVGD